MGIIDSFKEAYYSLEDKYYSLLDWLHGKGVPVYAVVDPIDRIVPSFPLAILLFAILLVLAAFAFSSFGPGFFKLLESFFPHAFSAKILVADALGNFVENADVKVSGEGLESEKATDAWGEAAFGLPRESVEADVTVSAEGFAAFSGKLELKSGEASRVVLSYIGGGPEAELQAGEKTVVVVNSETKKIIDDRSVMAELRCSTGKKKFEISGNPGYDRVVFSGGSFSVKSERDCGTLLASFTANGFEPKSSVPIANDTTNVELEPIASKPEQKGAVEVTVLDFNGSAFAGAQATLLDSHNSVADSMETDASGKAFFDKVRPGPYTVRVVARDGRSKSANVNVNADETAVVSIRLDAIAVDGKKIFLRTADSRTKAALPGVSISVFDSNSETGGASFFNSYTSDQNGVLERFVENRTFLGIFSFPGYVTRFVQPLPLKSRNDNAPEEIALEQATEQNSGKIRVSVLNQENLRPISEAKIFLYNSSYPGAVANNPYSLTNNDGNVLFEGLPAGTYRIEAEKDDFNGVAENIAVSLGQTTSVRILATIGSGSVKAVVTDWETGSPVENASVSFYNALSPQQELLAQKATGSGGEAANSFRSDAVIYLKAEKDGYISAITTRIDVIQNQETRSDIRLMSQSIDQNAGILSTLEGLYEDSQATRKAHSLEPNHYYFAKFAVALPQNKPYSNLVSHVRAGPDSMQTLPASGYVARIESAEVSSGGQTVLSNCFSAENVFSDPQNCIAQANAKQANAYWNNPENRTTYTEIVKIFVEPTAVAGTKIELHWQAKARVLDSDVLTQPLSREFGVSEPICTPGQDCPPIIWHFWLQREGSADRIPLDNFRQADRQMIDIFSESFLYAEALNSSGRNFDNLDISVASEDPDNAIVFPDKADATRTKILENAVFAQNSRKTSIGAGAEIMPLKFKPVVEAATAKLVVGVQSHAQEIGGAGQTLFFGIASDREMQFQNLPQNVFPAIDNQQVSGRLTDKSDGHAIANASVKMLADSRGPAISMTNSDGWFSFTISPAAENSVKFRATKPGYRQIESTPVPVQYSNVFNPLYDCITISKESLSMVPEQEDAFIVGAENCQEPAQVDIISQLDVQPKSFVLNPGNPEQSVSVLADNPANSGEVYLGQYPVFVRAKFESDILFIPAGRVIAFIAGNSGSCFGIDRTSFDFGTQSTQSAVISRNCPAGFVDAFRPETGIDSARVALQQNPALPGSISFKWKAIATGTENFFESTQSQSTQNGWKEFLVNTSSEFSSESIPVGINNVQDMRFDAYSLDSSDQCPGSNFAAAKDLKINNGSQNLNIACTISALPPTASGGCSPLLVEECLTGDNAKKCPLNQPCKHISAEVRMPAATANVNDISGSFYNKGNTNWLFVSVKADIPVTEITVEKRAVERSMESTEHTAAISNPRKGVKYYLGEGALNLFEHPDYHGGYYSDTVLDAVPTTETDKVRVWIEGGKVFAEFTGEPIALGGSFIVSLSNVSLSETAYALISVEDFASQVRNNDR